MVIEMGRYDLIIARLISTAKVSDDVHAVIAIGSTTRKLVKADEFSDLDVILVSSKPNDWIYGNRPDILGEIRINFTEPTLGNVNERRMILDENLDVDLIVLTPEQVRYFIEKGFANSVMNRGYIVLYDDMGVSEMLRKHVTVEDTITHSVMSEQEYLNMINDFCFHTLWAYKKLLRGELWTAKMCIDAYLKSKLLRMIEMFVLSCDKNADVWHNGRFLENWAGEEITKKLRNCFGRYDKGDLSTALTNTEKLFSELAEKTSANLGYAFPSKVICYAKECLDKMMGEM